MYLKMLSYSLGNGTRGIFLLRVISKLYKISITRLLLAFMKDFFLLFTSFLFTLTCTYLIFSVPKSHYWFCIIQYKAIMSCIITRFFHSCLSCTFNEEKFSLVKLWLIVYFPHHIALYTNWPLGPGSSRLHITHSSHGDGAPHGSEAYLFLTQVSSPRHSRLLDLIVCPASIFSSDWANALSKIQTDCSPVARVQGRIGWSPLHFFPHYVWTVLELRGFLVTAILSEITPYPFWKNGPIAVVPTVVRLLCQAVARQRWLIAGNGPERRPCSHA